MSVLVETNSNTLPAVILCVCAAVVQDSKRCKLQASNVPPKGALGDVTDCPNSPAPGLAGAPNGREGPKAAAAAADAFAGWPNKGVLG